MKGWVDLGYPAMDRAVQHISQTRNLSIARPTPYHYTTEPIKEAETEAKSSY